MSISRVGAKDTNTEILYSSLCLVKKTCTMMNITIVCVCIYRPLSFIANSTNTKNSKN